MGNIQLVKKAVSVLNAGGIIIFPTDTAFGIGCRIDNHQAVDRLFTIRKRPLTQATPVLVQSQNMALTYFLTPSDIVRRLMNNYWPGGLTIIDRCKKNLVYSPIRGGTDTIGLRMPNHETILEIIREVGIPILGPSANFHGDSTPYSIDQLNPELLKLVDFVVPGECTVKLASTVVDCSVAPYKVIRQGSVMVL